MPYLKRKLDDAYELYSGGAAQQLFGASYRTDALAEDATLREKAVHKLKALLRAVYPSVNAAYYFSMLAFNLGFLFDKTHYHTPWHYLIGVRMRRLTEADVVRVPLPLQHTPEGVLYTMG